MLILHRSTSLARLADTCADLLRAPATTDPFAPELLVASGALHERWLRQHLARRLGVCAHVRVLSPSTLAEEVAERVLGVGRDVTRAWRADRLRWQVLAALAERRNTPAFTPVRAWLVDADAPGSACSAGSARAVALAERVAGWFAGYAIGLPALARAWDAGAEPESWQAVLWRAVLIGLTGTDDLAGMHPAALADVVAERFQSSDPAVRAGLPARIVWFAQPGLGRVHVDTLIALAAAGVAVHALVPADGLPVADAAARHPLRRALGDHRAALDTLLVASVADAAAHGVAVVVRDLNEHSAPSSVVPAASTRSVLATVRERVIGTGAARALAVHAASPPLVDDASLAVHACHGPMRQAEVLRDALLALFERRHDLRPRDVLVLTPDVATYAPLLEAAFGGGDGVPELPLQVVDRPARLGNPAADVALRVLALAAGRVDAAAVLDLFGAPAVTARWQLDGGALELLRRWIEGAGARWGIDAADRAVARALPAADDAAWHPHGWRFALDRLLLGWGLPDDGQGAGFGGTVPWDEIEGEDADLLGRVAALCERLFTAVRAVRVARPLLAWCAELRAQVDALVWDPDVAADDALLLARQAFGASLDALGAEGAECQVPLDPAAIRAVLEARFAEPAGASGGVGAVTVAALGGGRVYPARVIALVGLDDLTFPRARSVDVLDRRVGTPAAPDAGAEDRVAVLDALLAAEEHLLITYTGRSPRTNEVLPPATPIALLLDAVEQACGEVHVLHEHPLAPFSSPPVCADGSGADPGTRDRRTGYSRGYDRAQQAGARAAAGPRRVAPAFVTRALPAHDRSNHELRPLALDTLVDALTQPARALIRERLGVRLERLEGEIATEDPLELDALERHGVRAAILAGLAAGRDAGTGARTLFERLRGAGHLPHGALGQLAYERGRQEALTVWHAGAEHRVGVARGAVRVEQTVGRYRLTGTVAPCWDAGLVALHGGMARARHLLAMWVHHLALHAGDPESGPAERPRSVLVALGEKDKITKQRQAVVHTFAPVDQSTAVLADLVALYKEAQGGVLPLLPASAWAYVSKRREAAADGPDAAGREAAVKAYADEYNPFCESSDHYVARLYGAAADPLDERFVALAERVWAPLKTAYQGT